MLMLSTLKEEEKEEMNLPLAGVVCSHIHKPVTSLIQGEYLSVLFPTRNQPLTEQTIQQ